MLRFSIHMPMAVLALLLMGGGRGVAASAPPLRLKTLMDIPLEGRATRLDYASVDAGRRLLFIAHLGDGEVIAVDTEAHRLLKRIANVAQVHGVLAIPELGRMYASATGTNEVVEVDPATDKIVRRIKVPGADGNHGLLIDSDSHRAFQFPVAKDPDVLAFDAQRQKLYVAGESGEVSEFRVAGNAISKSGESFPNAHVVAVQPSTHEIYFPLMNIDGKPVLRIMQPEAENP